MLTWPGWVIRFLEAYLAKVPFPEERIEFAIASLHHTHANRTRGRGTAPRAMEHFLPFRNAWGTQLADARYSDTDRAIFGRLGLR